LPFFVHHAIIAVFLEKSSQVPETLQIIGERPDGCGRAFCS
jgi:hypothetical protein